MSDDIFTQETVDKLNASALTFNEVVTSRAGGVSTGSLIDQTLTPLGEVTDTLKGRLDKIGTTFTDWGSTEGGTLTSAAQAFLNNTSGSAGFGNYYAWTGAFPHIVTPGLDPAATAGYAIRSNAQFFSAVTQTNDGTSVSEPSLDDLRDIMRRDTAGYVLIGNTTIGCTVTAERQTVKVLATGNEYEWTGALPKTVAPGEDPTSNPLWVLRTNAELRSDLAAYDGASLALSQVATAYGISFGSLSAFVPGATYNTGDYVYYGNTVWTPYADSTTQTDVTYEYFYRVPKRGEPWIPELFGAAGDGVSEEIDAFNRMKNALPAGTFVVLPSGSSYYFGLANGAADTFVIDKKLIFIGQGAKIIRRASTTSAADENMAAFHITASGAKVLGNIEFDGSEPEDRITIAGGGYHSDTREYATCGASSHLILIDGSPDDVEVVGPTLHNSCFNMWVNGAANLKVDVTVYKSGQTVPLTGSDLQLGAGVKLSNVYNYDVTVRGRFNTNASLEIEPSCFNGRAKLLSDSDFWSGLTATRNTNLTIDAVISNPGRYGAQIVNGNRTITGKIQVSGGADTAGLLLGMFDAGVDARDSYGIDINLMVDGITGRPLEIAQTAGLAVVRGYKVNLSAENVVSDYAVYCQTSGKGVITGYAAGTCTAACFNGCGETTTLRDFDASRCSGTYYAVTNPKFALENVTTHDGKKVTALYQNVATLGKSSTTTGGLETIEALGSYNLFTELMQAPYLQTTDTFVSVGGLWVNGGVVTRKES